MPRPDLAERSVAGRMTGRHAVVVGAGQTEGETIGNGRAIAIVLGRAGATVLCVDRSPERAEATASAIRDDGGSAVACAVDITADGAGDAVVAAALDLGPRIDALVNNVGIGGGGDGPAHRLEADAYDRIMDVNVRAMWRTCRSAIPQLREQGGGSIVNVSSAASVAGGFQTAYEVSKAAVNRLTTSIAQANARYGIRCNAIMLGLVDTPMAVGGIAAARGVPTDQVRRERDERVPLRGGMGDAWDTAFAALYLASDESRFVTGAVLPVDGGTTIRIG